MEKRFFFPIFRYLFILGHMLLHELYINVAIANIFHHAPALKDLRKLNNLQFTEKNMKKQ